MPADARSGERCLAFLKHWDDAGGRGLLLPKEAPRSHILFPILDLGELEPDTRG